MASAKKEDAKKDEATFDVDMPGGDDWRDESKVDIDGFYSPEKGKAFKGQLVDRLLLGDDQRDTVLVRLAHPFTAVVKGGDKVQLEAGQVLAVGIRTNLRTLLDYVDHRGYCFVGCTGKQQLDKGKSMWNFKVVCKGKKSAPPQPKTKSPAENFDDIPF